MFCGHCFFPSGRFGVRSVFCFAHNSNVHDHVLRAQEKKHPQEIIDAVYTITYALVMETKQRIARRLASRLRALRIHLEWTQAELADRAGLHRNTIAVLETRCPAGTSMQTYSAIARAMGWHLHELMSAKFKIQTPL